MGYLVHLRVVEQLGRIIDLSIEINLHMISENTTANDLQKFTFC
jgi:hypothetical protein